MSNTQSSTVNVEYNLPTICCSCGERKGTSLVQQINNVTAYSSGASGAKLIQTMYFYSVPLCEICKKQREDASANIDIDKILKRNAIISLGIVAIGMLIFRKDFFASSDLIELGGNAVVLFVVIYIILSAIYFGLVKTQLNNMASYDGKYFTFTNSRFQKEFATLNPNLVKPS